MAFKRFSSALEIWFDPNKLSDAAKETIEWVKTTHGTEWIYPLDPNLVLSTDDTTLFVFEGTSDISDDLNLVWFTDDT